jgi:hypothetical protein
MVMGVIVLVSLKGVVMVYLISIDKMMYSEIVMMKSVMTGIIQQVMDVELRVEQKIDVETGM